MKPLIIITCSLFTGFFIMIGLPSAGQKKSLDNYACLTEFFNIDNWEKEKNVSFDSNGLVLTKEKYHPLSIVQYGILAYYKYLETSDALYRDKFLNQVAYFKDTSKVHYLNEGKSVGLPYNFNFLDLEAPWYSGMTQGNAASFLLRYYEWSGDTTIIPVIQKIIHLLTLPVEKGGTISKTAEGYTWIEEYPNSKKSRQVLNGFINGWIGLYEYCLFFPKDTFSCRIRDESYDALKKSLDKYETPDGVYYNRSKKKCSNGYIRYQIHQMDQLYRLTGEDLFRKQKMLWSFMVYDKPNNEKTEKFLIKDFNYSVPLRDTANFMLPAFNFLSLNNNGIMAVTINDKPLTKGNQNGLFNAGGDSSFVFKSRGLKNRKKMHMQVELRDSLNVDKLMIRIAPGIKKTKENFRLGFTSDRNPARVSSQIIDQEKEGDLICLDLRNEKTNIIDFIAQSNQKVSDWELGGLEIFLTPEKKPPCFAHYLSDIIPVGDRVSVTIDSRFTGDPVVFYRYHPRNDSVRKSGWKLAQSYSGKHGEIINFDPAEQYYQFLVVFDIRGPQSLVRSISIIN